MRDCTKCMPSPVSSSAAIAGKERRAGDALGEDVEQHHDERAEDDVEEAPAVRVVAVAHVADDAR